MQRARGFSLLEVLVAFAILALVGGVLFQIFGGALRNAGVAEDYSRAALIADSKLATLGIEQPLREGSEGGSEGGGRFNWVLNVTPYVPPEGAAQTEGITPNLPQRLLQAAVTVSWEAGETPRSITVTTVRLVPKETP